MILADTSVWIDHLRRGNARLALLLDAGQIVSHPMIIGELACGTLARRAVFLDLINALPGAALATHTEALAFLQARRLMGRGLGYVDVHLLASTMLDDMQLWSLDKQLDTAARTLGIAHRV